MVNLLSDKWELKSKHSTTEALQRWRDLCVFVKNPKRRFRFTANLSMRHQAAAMQNTIQENMRIAVLVSKAAFYFVNPSQPNEYNIPKEVEAAGFRICADEVGSIVEKHDIKKLKYHGGVTGLAGKLATDVVNGISTDGEALTCRQEIFGINKFEEREAKGYWVFVWEALHDMTLMILIVCALVSLVVGIATEGWPEGAHDGLGIVASILLVVIVTATSDYRQSLQFMDLDKEKKKISIQVVRDGYRQKMSIYELLPGDIVHLAIGDQVPADGLFLSGFSVLIDESSLTGESEPILVNAEYPFLMSGTKVQDGSCKMMVTTVGMRTQWGKLLATLSEGGEDETPLQVKLNGVATFIGKIGIVFALVTFAVLVQRIFASKWQAGMMLSWSGDDALELLEYFAIAVTIVVVAVPEGLPLAVTLSLAFAMKKMMNDKALVRHLAACETMGSATSICSDKTGTLTTNHMTVVKSCVCMKVKELTEPESGSTLHSELPKSVVEILMQSIFNNTAGEVVVNKDGKREILGTPTEAAILEFGMSLGGNFHVERRKSKLVKVEPFNSTKKRMGVVLELHGGGLRAHTKGASEIILAACNKFINSNGEIVPLDENSFNHLKGTIEQFACEALRTLCLAYMDLENGFCGDDIPASGYTCIGIVGIKDPVRPGVRESVALCRSAGITIRMVTGDNIHTAKAIARECGILTDDGVAIEGPDFREKSLEELHELIPKIQVMARSSPLDKHTLVKHLRTTFNEVVAVTGDGTNDAPALHEADIGLAMGIAGTEVAKESADVIILDDNFSTIATVAKWGRSVYVNIQKFVQFQLTVNIVALVVNFSSACLTGSAPLTAVQLLWVNMIMDTLGALALATEPPNEELMKKPPVGRKGNFISSVMWRNILGQSFYQFLVLGSLQAYGKTYFGLYGIPDSDLVLNTIIFNTFVFCQLFNEVNSREMQKINVLKGILNSYVFVSVLGSTVLFQIIIVEFLGTFANTTPLTLTQWLASIFIGFLSMPIAAALKRYFPLSN
ncbi:calcium-transporting ATPase 2, plasma membrane-type-like [Andrographis paniculata]|uniref:calcium-transporting ATPase 2, plasma membrane-type-like n=1 Tax=Andrographis paniculata TaxID=175694 RepID=UPI0021E8947C|nr:calcium-transporting ATPase 2, plasma membrane-type-like [Andrographis paniculata]